jgi:hypothetical protein
MHPAVYRWIVALAGVHAYHLLIGLATARSF